MDSGRSAHIAAARPGYETLLYRNQFVLGPRYMEHFPSWKKVAAGDSICLTVHPDLSCCQAGANGKSVTLLGFILDPADPNATDQWIVNDLVCKLSRCQDFFPHTYRYGGRWVLIASDGNTTALFHDAAGIRQVFYTNARYGTDIWCASQPGLLAERLGLQMSQQALGLIDSYSFRQNREYWWPGNGSPYEEISHLPPNHWLDLGTRQVRRYWPWENLPERPLEDIVVKSAANLRGLIESAAKRFELAQSITAGWDSRLMLAASKNVAQRISYLTVRQIGMRETHPDISVPARLLPRLGLKHHVVGASLLTDPDFVRTFKTNVTLAHDHYAPDAYSILKYYGLRRAVISGGVSEIVRDPTVGTERSVRGSISPSEMSEELYRTGNNPFAIREIENWLSGIGNIYNVDLDTIFFWEQREGNWLAGNQLEFDSAWQEIIIPYNCRGLLIDMLSVREHDRKHPKNLLFRELIRNLWPDVLLEPINPHKNNTHLMMLKSKLRKQIKRLLLRIPQVRNRVEGRG